MSNMTPKVCVFGLWHLGSVTAACLADLGFDVRGLDFNANVIADLSAGKPPLFEPGLSEMVAKNISEKRLSFYTKPQDALTGVDYLWVTFDTPVDEDDIADVAFLESQFFKITDYIVAGTKVIFSSQAPVGFIARVETEFLKKYPNKKVYFACSPENLRLGNAIKIFKEPDRIIIGVRDPSHVTLYEPLLSKISKNLEWMKTESAEMTKHAINTFLATSIVFANEIATICEAVGADAKEVERGLKSEVRIGPKAYVGPGLAFAGGTLARDINFLIERSDKLGQKSTLLRAIKQSNDNHKSWIQNKCIAIYPQLKDVQFGILGLTYKPNTDTLRRSSAIELAQWLNKQGAIVHAYDPHLTSLPDEYSKIIKLHSNVESVLDNSNCVIIACEHNAFKPLFVSHVASLSKKILIDPTGLLSKEMPATYMGRYIRVGRDL